MRRFAFAVAGLLVFGGCASPSHPGDPGNVTPGVQVQTGREFDIAVGQTVEVQGTPMTIRFSGVAEDSRCPVDVQCVWAGDAVIELHWTPTAGQTRDLTLHLNPQAGPQAARLDAREVTFTHLDDARPQASLRIDRAP